MKPPAGLPARHRTADGECDRSIGAGVRGRQPRWWDPGLRPVNQGPGETAWFGRETPAAIARLEFLRGVAGPMLRQVLEFRGRSTSFALAAQGVQIGDDVHMRTQGTTSLLIRNLLPQIAALPDAGGSTWRNTCPATTCSS